MTSRPSPRGAASTLLALLLATALPPAPVSAQAEPPGIRLTLMAQTTTLTPGQSFRIAVRATNATGRPIGDLTLSLWVYHPAGSRSAYLQGLEAEPPTAPLLIASVPQVGQIHAGESRAIRIRRVLPEVEGLGENALFPLKVQLESQGVPVASLRSALVFIRDRPLVPLNLSITVVLAPPARFRPDETFLDSELERAIADGGTVDGVVSALEDFPANVTLVVAPLFLQSLARMSDGYRVAEPGGTRQVPPGSPRAAAAAAMLERIREVARRPSTEVVAMPYAEPSIPSLLASGLGSDLQPQLQHGRDETERLLGTVPVATILRPPGSRLTHESIDALSRTEIQTLILDAEQLPPSSELTFSPPATALVNGQMVAVAPDPGIDATLHRQQDDPRLRAQWVLGELAAVYFEFPSEVRGAAIVLDAGEAPPPELIRPLLAAAAAPPAEAAWMAPKKVSQLISAVPPELPRDRRRLRATEEERFSSFYEGELDAARAAITQFRSMAGEVPLAARLRQMLLVAEHRRFLEREAEGLEFVRSVRGALGTEFAKVAAPAETSITLTSRGGVIPVTLESEAGYDIRVRVTLFSPRLEFLEGASREVTLADQARAITFPVRAQTTGRFPVRVLIATPAGRAIAESQIVVRSTAYNTVALFIAIGAALFLAAWWGRRLLRPTNA